MKIKEIKKCCATCKNSRWFLTPTGRLPIDSRNKVNVGQCVAEFVPPELPAFIRTPEWQRVHIRLIDGEDCQLYEVNEGKPIAREPKELS